VHNIIIVVFDSLVDSQFSHVGFEAFVAPLTMILNEVMRIVAIAELFSKF